MAAKHPAPRAGRAAGQNDSADPVTGGGQSGAGDGDLFLWRFFRRAYWRLSSRLDQRSRMAEGADLGRGIAVVAAVFDRRLSQTQSAVDVAGGDGREG